MSAWIIIADVLILLGGGLVLGALFERLGQSAVLGYLLAGVLLGPRVLHFVEREEEVRALADIGVALLLFSIGLEFSWPRLKELGGLALVGGTVQVVGTAAVAGAGAVLLGVPVRGAIAVGAAIALSSTACVLRLLRDRSELDSQHGRASLGILLLQDVAVVPLVVLVVALTGEGGIGTVAGALGLKLAMVVPFVAVAWVLFARFVPWALGREAMSRGRDLPILMAVVLALGAALGAERIGLSPALGAFIAGVLLAETPFAAQIRSDVAPPRTLLVALFFGGIGMLADPAWMWSNAPALLAIVAALIAVKIGVVWGALRLLRQPHRTGLAAGLALAQVGEFSFLLVTAGGASLLGPEAFRFLVSSIVLTLLLTPFLVAAAARVVRRTIAEGGAGPVEEEDGGPTALVVGFGPAARGVACALHDAGERVLVLDLNPRLLDLARTYDLDAEHGDATHRDVLAHLPGKAVRLVVVTVPDPATAALAVEQARVVFPLARVLARSRYSRSRDELERSGAEVVVDEEATVGEALVAKVLTMREDAEPTPEDEQDG